MDTSINLIVVTVSLCVKNYPIAHFKQRRLVRVSSASTKTICKIKMFCKAKEKKKHTQKTTQNTKNRFGEIVATHFKDAGPILLRGPGLISSTCYEALVNHKEERVNYVKNSSQKRKYQ